ncbi:MAG: metallophosphoesterase family protein [Solirubrobacteraceae bacterium]
MVTPKQLLEIERAGVLRFHCVGDTGGLVDPRPQRAVAAAMIGELNGPEPVDFFYHLGDVVYLHGEQSGYGAQFFSPYARYAAPIFAVPGNHDGDPAPGGREQSLDAFVRTFCVEGGPLRPTVGQPHVFWTLVHPWLRIVGLYTNVPEGGQVGDDQLEWLTGELRAAPPEVTLILAMHHPVYSIDIVHGSNLAFGDVLDDCFRRAGRAPDAVFSAHSHNYQRFSRWHQGRLIPYVVAGSGGFYERHGLGWGVPPTPATFPEPTDVTLECHQDSGYGFMTVSAGPAGARVVYSTVCGVAFDRFAIVPAAAS